MNSIGVLMVCLGNICRSPTAEGIFRKLAAEHNGLAQRIRVDSAGMSDWHVGDPPDARAQATALEHGVDLSGQRSRAVRMEDFEDFAYIVAMDEENYACLLENCPKRRRNRLYRCLDFAPAIDLSGVPDPYYGGPNGFETVYEIVETCMAGLLKKIAEDHSAHA